MKRVLYVILDGLGDRPLPELDDRTPLEAAATPNLDRLADAGRQGTVVTVGKGIAPESDVAVMAVLGYDPMRYNVLLFLTFAVAIAVATDAIGALPVFGLLILPPAAALVVTREMAAAVKLAPVLGGIAAVVGYLLSWLMDLPTGAMQVVTGVIVLGACALLARIRR